MYSYENYHKVKEEIEKRRTDAIARADARAEKLRSESEEIRIIDEQLSKTGLLIFKAACSGGDIAPIREQNKLLNARRGEILKKMGYPEDYSDIKYFCEKCSDSGYIGGAKMCSCFHEALVKATIASSGIGDLIEKQSFENFDLSRFNQDPKLKAKMSEVLRDAKDYVATFDNKKNNLLLIGTTGTGKTHISTAIARKLIEKGYDVIYDSIHNIISDFEDDKFKSGYSYTEQKSAKYLECDILIIDDLGTEFSNQFTTSCLYNLLNTRINQGKATIISTNLSGTELSEKYDDRIYSRIVGKSEIIRFEGNDQRLGF